MAGGMQGGAEQFALLGRQLKELGAGELRKGLYKAINEAARPLAREIARVSHLEPYMPDRYAPVLAADLTVTVVKSTSDANPGVTIRAKGRLRQRKVRYLDQGTINHPVYATGERSTWRWSNGQRGGMKAGFFSDPTSHAAPEVRAAILREMTDIARKLGG